MKKGGGSNKGSAFERELCKKFSLWVSDGNRDDLYWRTAGSGARASVRGKKEMATANSCGDMGCLDPEGAWLTDSFMFEFKRGYNTWRVEDFLFKQKCALGLVWKKLSQEALKEKKFAVLILKQDRRQPLLFSTPFFFIRILQKWDKIPVLSIPATENDEDEIWTMKLNFQEMPSPVPFHHSSGSEFRRKNFPQKTNK